MATLHLLTTRHEAKMKPVGKIIPGSVEDQRLPLSYEGAKNAYKTGQDSKVVPPGCGVVIAGRSTLVRTTQTLQQMLAGAGYNPDDTASVQWQPESVETGLACGYNFEYPGLPAYSPQNPAADNYVKALLEQCFVPVDSDKTRPVMAAMGYALLNSMITGIETALPFVRDGGNVLVTQATHAPFIDALDAVLFDTVTIDAAGKGTVQEPAVGGWQGHYAMGEFIKGEIYQVNLGNIPTDPTFLINGKKGIFKSGRSVLFSLDTLKKIRDKAYNLSLGKF